MTNAIPYAKFRSRSHDAVIRVYDPAGTVIETHEQRRFQGMVTLETESRHAAKRDG